MESSLKSDEEVIHRGLIARIATDLSDGSEQEREEGEKGEG
jgi:hypothetical protein